MPPPHARHTPRVNQLLDNLSEEDRESFTTAFRVERPPPNFMLGNRTDAAPDIWFPHNGVVALSITDHEGRTVQTGLVGAEGCIGLENMFPNTPAMADAWVQIAGDMSVIAAPALRAAADARPAIQAALFRFLYDLSAQSQQTILCNRLHSLEARCCRWLLMMHDRTHRNDLPLTQESLATMLGSGRPRINGLLAALEHQGVVRRYRGRISLLTRTGLEARTCECYRALSLR